MNLMDKFNKVEIKADNRISDYDRQFCQKHQDAFDKSGVYLRRLASELSTAIAEQKALLGGDEWVYSIYMNRDHLTVEHVNKALEDRPKAFISAIVSYFCRNYHVELDEEKICNHLLPARPRACGWNADLEALEAYSSMLQCLELRYESIVDEIFVQLDGFSFAERGINEMKQKCWEASHISGREENFEVKKDTLRLTRYYCSYDASWSTPQWEVLDDTRSILDGIAHFESGMLGAGYIFFSTLFNYHIEENLFVYPGLQKIKSIRLFKNSRVDITFTNSTFAQEFVDQYLRITPVN